MRRTVVVTALILVLSPELAGAQPRPMGALKEPIKDVAVSILRELIRFVMIGEGHCTLDPNGICSGAAPAPDGHCTLDPNGGGGCTS
jgi:hypothetical protein